MTRVGVVIPVGPHRHHQQYLDEALASIDYQTKQVDILILVDDMANVRFSSYKRPSVGDLRIWRAPWRLGVAAAFNMGIARAFAAGCHIAIMLGADDLLKPDCVETITAAFETGGSRDGYYWMGVQYSDGREDQYLPCHAAAVTPGLWRLTGGFSPAMALWAPDAAFVSVLLAHHPELLIGVAVAEGKGGRPLYWHRIHENQATADGEHWARSGIGNSVRDYVTENWEPAEGWGRYE